MQNSLVIKVMIISIINGTKKYFKFGMCPTNSVPTSLDTISVLKICRYEMLNCFFFIFLNEIDRQYRISILYHFNNVAIMATQIANVDKQYYIK